MQDVITFLDRVGRDASLKHATLRDLDEVMQSEGLAPTIRSAILQKDTQRLAALIGAEQDLCCMVAIPDENDESPWPGGALRA